MENILISLLAGIASAVIVFWILQNRNKGNADKNGEEVVAAVEMKLRALMPEILRDTNESLVTMANEKLGSEKKEIKTDLENKRSEIERMIKMIQQDLKTNNEKLEQTDKERVGSYRALQTRLDEYKTITLQLKASAENLNKVLSSNQMRGQFGEQVAEDLLKISGFVKGENYTVQESGEGIRPDFTIYLPDKTKINVDAKFPFNNLQKMVETEDEMQKKKFKEDFKTDIKNKIRQVATRDYINPMEKTVDFVILFIPNEMIFSYVYDEIPDVWEEAMRKKVILAGPFSFTAILRMINQSYDNFRYQSNIQEIIGHIKVFEKEFEKFNEAFSKVGTKIQQLEGAYSEVATTRSNVLSRTIEKVKLASPSEKEEPLKLLPTEE